MPDTIILTETPVSEIAATPAPVAEAQSIAATEAVVEVAQIEADRDIAIAEIHAETTEALIEAEAEEGAEETDLVLEGIDECRRNIETLTGTVETLATLISERLPPAPPPPPDLSPDDASADAPQEADVPPAPPPPKTKKSRWI